MLIACAICHRPNTSIYTSFKEERFATMDNGKIICICDTCASHLKEDKFELYEEIPYDIEILKK